MGGTGTRRRFLGVALAMTFAAVVFAPREGRLDAAAGGAVFFLGGISSDGSVEGDGLETMRGNRELMEGRER